jgi:hypothetical protein
MAPQSIPPYPAKISKNTSHPLVIAIGFNKCGTSSLHDFFIKNGHVSLHWRANQNQFLAPLIYCNLHLGRPLLHGLEHAVLLSDLFYLDANSYLEANFLFKEIAAQYPNARFILNTRNRDAWLLSRSRHQTPGQSGMLGRAARFLGLSENETLAVWADQWEKHHAAVRDFFKNSAPRFLEFNIETDNAAKLVDFLSDQLALDAGKFRHLNKST